MSNIIDCPMNILGHRTTAMILGFKGAIIFGPLFVFLGAFAWYSFLISDTFDPDQNIWVQIANGELERSPTFQNSQFRLVSALNMDWFYYVYLWFCSLMFIASLCLIQAVRSVRD